MRIDVISIFPDYLSPLRLSLVGRAIESGIVDLRVHDLRNWTHDRHRTVDDTPYGGGPGMVMRPEPWGEALDQIAGESTRPAGVQSRPGARSRSRWPRSWRRNAPGPGLWALRGHRRPGARPYARSQMRTDEVSIGDYVLNGGEAAALVVIEAVVRLLPGVIGNPESLTEESHATGQAGLLEYPLYTKPPSWRGLDVPEILFSGHHAQIAGLAARAGRGQDPCVRPDLLPGDRLDCGCLGRRLGMSGRGWPSPSTNSSGSHGSPGGAQQRRQVGGLFETLTMGGRACFLKVLSADSDWIMRCTGNRVTGSSRLAGRAVPGRARGDRPGDDRDGPRRNRARAARLAMLMHDYSAYLVPPGDSPIAAAQHARFLTHMAAMHAHHWGWQDQLGLCSVQQRLLFFAPATIAPELPRTRARSLRVAARGWALLPLSTRR